MTDKEINEGNKLIVEFMSNGVDEYDHPIGKVYVSDFSKINGRSIDSKFPFHTSWDWLMPVVEKMEKIDGHFTIGTNKIDYQCKGFGGSSRVGFGYTKIQCVWEVVIQFIQWYNSQSKTDNNDRQESNTKKGAA